MKPEILHVRSLLLRAAFESNTHVLITYCVSGVTLKLTRSYLWYDFPRVKWERPNCVSSINNKDGPSIQNIAEQIGFVIATGFEGAVNKRCADFSPFLYFRFPCLRFRKGKGHNWRTAWVEVGYNWGYRLLAFSWTRFSGCVSHR